KIPADKTSAGINSELDQRIEDRVMKDFADVAAGKERMPDIKDFGKAIALYKIAKDFDKRDAEKANPIQKDLQKLLALSSFSDFEQKAADLFMGPYTLPFVFDVDADMKNTDVNVLHFGGPSTFLPDTTTYKTADAKKLDRKSTRLNSSHVSISYAVFCLKKKKSKMNQHKIIQENHIKNARYDKGEQVR